MKDVKKILVKLFRISVFADCLASGLVIMGVPPSNHYVFPVERDDNGLFAVSLLFYLSLIKLYHKIGVLTNIVENEDIFI